MVVGELKHSVREYRRLWEDSGLELSPHWRGAEDRVSLGEPKSAAVEVKGDPASDLYFLGEGLSTAEIALLSKIIEAMGRRPDSVLVASLLPQGAEGQPFNTFREQSGRAKVIVALGAGAASKLLGQPGTRGKFQSLGGCLVMPTLSPSALLANPAEKKSVWEDMKLVLGQLGSGK